MNIQVAPNEWSCLATSFAMIFDTPVEKVFELLGHDGGRVAWPHLPEPYCRRGHHVQELVCVGTLLGYAVVVLEKTIELLDPLAKTDGKLVGNFDFKIKQRGVLMGTYGECRHAVAYEGGMFYNPNGTFYPLADSRLKIEVYCPVFKIAD